MNDTYAIRNSETGRIETVHTVLIDQVLKGNVSPLSVEVHTPGGQLHDVISTVSHGATLESGQRGIFFAYAKSKQRLLFACWECR